MNVSSIPAWFSFTDALAQWLLHEHELPLEDTLILLPNRRACRSLREALTKYSQGRAMILPRMMPFADLDPEDAVLSPQWIDHDVLPPISVSSRLGILMQLIIKYGQAVGESGYGQASHAIQLAGELARLIDQIHWEGLPFSAIAQLVPEDYAKHWQITLDFLAIITEHWPAIMAARGVSDPAAWRRDLILAYADRWRNQPPVHGVIAAGSTGSIPCTAELMGVVAQLPHGHVILPGLDQVMPSEEWDQLDITHPQYGMAKLLHQFGVSRESVKPLNVSVPAGNAARFTTLSRAMQPSIGGSWLVEPEIAQAACAHFHIHECATPAEEAGVIALIMREALEKPDQTVALVTPDRQLVARVHRELERWDLKADDTAGGILADIPAGNFMLLLAQALLEPESILHLMNVLHHPYVVNEQILVWDKTICRQHRKVSQMVAASEAFSLFHQGYSEAAADFMELAAQESCSLSKLIAAHFKIALFLAQDKLGQGDHGEAFADFWSNLHQATDDFPDISAKDYPSLLQQLMANVNVREPYGYHPRLFILGPLEARIMKTDVMILGGLNEGAWPSLTEADPWLNRPMRKEYGLPLPERRIGLSAHDFAQAFCAKRVVCTRSLRVGGAPTVASRWLLRLETVLRASQIKLDTSPQPWAHWHQSLYRPAVITPQARPMPRPPLGARPRQMSVTQVEMWMRDPYALYARQILKLRELDPLEKPITVAEKGTIIHDILDTFVRSEVQDLKSLLALGEGIFSTFGEQPEVVNFWWPRFERIAAWFVQEQYERREYISKSITETSGLLEVATKAGIFNITAKADRLDLRRDGSVDVIDYKTGGIPSVKEVEQGMAPQLTLEASIVAGGGFKDLGVRTVRSLQYWRLRGSNPAGEIRTIDLWDKKLQADALEGLIRLVETYAHEDVPYIAQPRAKHALKYNPYAHLTRTQEWMKEVA